MLCTSTLTATRLRHGLSNSYVKRFPMTRRQSISFSTATPFSIHVSWTRSGRWISSRPETVLANWPISSRISNGERHQDVELSAIADKYNVTLFWIIRYAVDEFLDRLYSRSDSANPQLLRVLDNFCRLQTPPLLIDPRSLAWRRALFA